MRIDREKLVALAALPDPQLWAEIRKFAAQKGFRLPETQPPHEDLERLRRTVTDTDKIQVAEALRIVNEYRRRQGL